MQHLISVLLLVLILSACSSQEPPATPPSQVATRITATLAPTFTFTPTATATSTATPLPTYTPFATYTPVATYTPFPTYTPLPTNTATPIPTATPIAVAPNTSADWPTTIRGIADSVGGDSTELTNVLVGLQAVQQAGGSVKRIDLTNDGQDELLVWYLDPNNPDSNTGSNVLLFADDGQNWRPIFDAALSVGGYGGARLLDARDLNNDRQNELAYALTSCGTSVCSTNVLVTVWNGSTFRNLTVSDIRLPSLRSGTFRDPDEDKLFDMILTGGALESAAAGPQRERTEIYNWTPNGYALKEVQYAATDSLPLILWEANEVVEAGDFNKAIELYERVASDETLRPWAQGTDDPALVEQEKKLLQTFSRFRLMLTHAAADNRGSVQQTLDGLRALYSDSPFREAADLFMEEWRLEGDLAAACALANEYAASQSDTMIEPLNNFGYTGPLFLPQDICPF